MRAVLYEETSDAGTYIEPKCPKYELRDIGVLPNTVDPVMVGTDEAKMYTDSSFTHDLKH